MPSLLSCSKQHEESIFLRNYLSILLFPVSHTWDKFPRSSYFASVDESGKGGREFSHLDIKTSWHGGLDLGLLATEFKFLVLIFSLIGL